MTLSSEDLSAYIDGEIAGEAALRIEAELAGRPDLQAFVAQQRMLARALHDSFDDVLNAPVPDALLNAVVRPASPWSAARAKMASLFARQTVLWSGSLAAAALAFGVLLGTQIPGSGDIASSGGVLTVRGTLAQALNADLSAAPDAHVAINLSFRDKQGRYCRSFQTSGADAVAGVACHADGGWQIAALARHAPQTGAGAYQQAGSEMPGFVRDAIEGMIAGAPLDEAGERKAREAGWR